MYPPSCELSCGASLPPKTLGPSVCPPSSLCPWHHPLLPASTVLPFQHALPSGTRCVAFSRLASFA